MNTPTNPAPSAADNNGEDYRQPDHREHPETRTDVTNTTPATYADDLYAALNATKAALAAKDREIENLVWNLAGCDTLAIGYAKPGEFSKELARPALHSVSKLRAERDALRSEVERLKAHEGDLVIGAAILNGARQQEAESVDQLRARLGTAQAALAAAQATAREAMEEADHYKRIFKSNGASMELMVSRIPTGGQVIDAVIRAAAVTADSPGVLVWSANAAEQIEAALAKIAEEGQAQP